MGNEELSFSEFLPARKVPVNIAVKQPTDNLPVFDKAADQIIKLAKDSSNIRNRRRSIDILDNNLEAVEENIQINIEDDYLLSSVSNTKIHST